METCVTGNNLILHKAIKACCHKNIGELKKLIKKPMDDQCMFMFSTPCLKLYNQTPTGIPNGGDAVFSHCFNLKYLDWVGICCQANQNCKNVCLNKLPTSK